MKKLAAFLALIPSVLWSQVVIEDHKGSRIDGFTRATKAVITTDEEHGYATRFAIAHLLGISTSLTNNKSATIDGRTYVYVTALGSPGANETHVLIGANGPESADNLYNAFNDTGTGEGVTYLQHAGVTGPHPNWTAWRRTGITGPQELYVHYNVAGPTGIGKTLSAQSPLQWNSGSTGDTTTDIFWWIKISGGQGDWGTATTNKCTRAYYVGPSSFTADSINSSAIATTYDSYISSGLPKLKIRRSDPACNDTIYQSTDLNLHVQTEIPPQSSTLKFTLPTKCSDPDDEIECSKAYLWPDNQKAYSQRGAMTNGGFVVANGTITITLAAPFPDGVPLAENAQGNGYEDMTTDRHIHVRGLQQYATATNPGYDGSANDPAQSCATLFSKTTTNDRVFKVIAVNPARTEIKIRNPSDCPLVDGTYFPTCLPAAICSGQTSSVGYVAITFYAQPYVNVRFRPTIGYIYPPGYMFYNAKSGTFDPDSNRFTFHVKFGRNNNRSYSGGPDFQFGTYAQSGNWDHVGGNGGTHYYHFANHSVYPDEWMKYEITSHVTHQVGGGGTTPSNWPNEPLKGQIYMPGYQGGPRGYMEGQTLTYLDFTAIGGYHSAQPDGGGWEGQDVYLGPIEMSKVEGEPEDIIGTRNITYGTDRYTAHPYLERTMGNNGYEVNWQGHAMSGITYKVRYSTESTSIRTAGWSTATDGGTTTSPGAPTNGATWFIAPASAKFANFNAAIRPVMPIYNVNNSSPTWFFTRYALGLDVADTITTESIGGNTAANVTNQPVSAVQDRKFWYRFEPSISLIWTNPYTLNSITAASNICTASVTSDHGIVIGTPIEVMGSTSSVLATLTAKQYIVTSTPTATSFTFTCTGVPNSVYQGDYVPGPGEGRPHLSIMTYPGVAVASAGNGAYTSGGTIESTGENKGFAEIRWEEYSPTGAPVTLPNTPSGFTASANGETQINLTWTDNATDETFQEIQRCTGAGCSGYAPLITLDTDIEAYSNTGLASGTTYQYRLRACNAGGCSGYVSASTMTASPATGPTAPSGLTVSELYSDRVVLTWTDNSSDETSFVVRQDATTEVCTVGANVTTCEVGSLSPSTEYDFEVKAVNGNGSSAYSSPVTTTTLVSLSVNIQNLVSTGVILKWEAINSDPCTVTVLEGQNVILSTSSTSGPVNRKQIVTGLNPETPYTTSVVCGVTAWNGEFTTPVAVGGSTEIKLSAPVPQGYSDINNLVIYAGETEESLTHVGRTPCLTSRCSVTVTLPNDSILTARRYWCYNPDGADNQCISAANLRAKSGSFSLKVGRP